MAGAVLRILVSRLRFIGDIVISTPVLEALRQRFSDAVIDYLGDRQGVSLLLRNPFVNDIIPYDFLAPGIKEQIRVARLLRKRKYDVAIDLFGNPRSAILMLLSGAKMRIGGNFGWRGRTYTHPITIRERLTAVDFHLRYLKPLGIESRQMRPRIFLTGEDIDASAKYLESIGVDNSKPKVGFHVGATWPAKVWPPENFARLASLVCNRLGAQVLVTYGPKDRQILDRITLSSEIKSFVIEPREIRELASIISLCDAYVSNDAAPMHISAAVGTPTVGIFGPGEPGIWFPYQVEFGHVALHKNVECCHKDFCDLKGKDYLRCMNEIKPDEVFETLVRILDAKRMKHTLENHI